MGVQGLWELLAPVGRRVSVETLAGKKLAIDASIWMIQFMKAMRDERGEMVRNAHILGFFRRICKLLFLRTKPIFVFDGGTPALKRRTVAARRRHRENARAKIRKTAEKLLLNHLKAKRLEELATEIKNNRRKDESKGKQVAVDDGSGVEGRNLGNGDQERLDELLAASLAVEEEGTFATKESTSGSNVFVEEGVDGDENEEMLFPVMNSNVDPAVLASLPPSMQLDLLVQMRERLMAENRQKYQKIKKAPTKFSELQIQSYLKTVAFRREIDEVQKCAAGKGLGGVQTSRIASEANREFIFSSSFTGDKQMLSSGIGRNKDANHTAQDKATSSGATKSVPMKSNSVIGSCVGEPISNFVNDVETYLDERGHLRVSRVRGMGIHMTRDLQRNLDMMREYEQGKGVGNICKYPMPNSNKRDSEATKVACGMSYLTKASSSYDDGENMSRGSMVPDQDVAYQFDVPAVCPSKATIEISFLEDEAQNQDEDKNLFFQLVSGSSAWESSVASTPTGKLSHDSESDCDWEEGIIVDNTGNLKGNIKEQSQPSLAEKIIGEEGEVDWEEGTCQALNGTAHDLAEYDRRVSRGHVSRGNLDEEADIQEAIRRSLEDFGRQKPLTNSSENQHADTHLQLEKYPKVSEPGHIGYASREDIELAADSVENHLYSPAATKFPLLSRDSSQRHLLSPDTAEVNCEGAANVINAKNKNLLMSDTEINRQSVINSGSTRTLHIDNVPMIKSVEGQVTLEKESMDTLKHGDEPCFILSVETEANSDISMENKCKSPDFIPSNNHDADLHVPQESDILEQKYESSNSQNNASMKTIKNAPVGMDLEQQTRTKTGNGIPTREVETYEYATKSQDNVSDHLEFTQASLDEEISVLRQERIDLGDEQRKLERNAEFVSSEMFAECQELLQMFGLPYIIAPMEAEAQCAFMEMTKQVDGVITDDSDVFLFGARNVYKNIFDDRKYVETYFMKDIETEIGLPREKLIRMALLLGSDYTEGISGIGIVNAIEVVHAFPEEDGLQKFRAWLESPDPSILGQFDSGIDCKSKKRSSESSDGDADAILGDHERSAREECYKSKDHDPAADEIPDVKNVFMNKHRKVSKNWHVPSSFPSDSVVSAYVSPQVDESLESFQWGKPDLFLLRKLCWEKFGWNNQKADELLLPVLKEYNKHETQLRLEAFYSFNERFAKVRSQRIKKAIKGITGSCSTELTDYVPREGSNSKQSRRKRLNPAGAEKSKSKSCSNGGINCDENSSNPSQSEDGIGASCTSNYDGKSAKSGRMADYGVRGRRNGSGRGRGSKKGEQNPRIRSSETSDDIDGSGDSEKHNKPEDTLELRRSMRQRKHVRYAEDCCEDDTAAGSNTTIVAQKPVKDSSTAPDDSSGLNKDLTKDQDPVADNPSKDFLLTGGGFCADESNQNGDAFGDASPVMDSVELSSLDPSNSDQIIDQGSLPAQDDPKLRRVQEHSAAQIDHLDPEQAAGEVESKAALSAMPSLKRKRRKT